MQCTIWETSLYYIMIIIYLTVCVQGTKNKAYSWKILSYDCFPCVSLDFPPTKYCLFGSAVACNCELIHLSSFYGVWMWLKFFWHVYIMCLFSTKTECLYCPKYEHVSVEKKKNHKRLLNVQQCVSLVVWGELTVLSEHVLSTIDCLCNPRPSCKRLKLHKGGKKIYFKTCLRLYVLDVACYVDGSSVHFAYRFCLKRDSVCIDLSVCRL